MTSTFGTHTHSINIMMRLYRYKTSDERGRTVEKSPEHGGIQEVHAIERETPRDHISYRSESKCYQRWN